MTTKKVLLMAGLLAAIGIAYWGFSGTAVDDGEEGAIGAANRARTEQISDSDVDLKDAEVIALLQDDVFLELIQDEDFQELLASRDNVAALGKQGVAILGKADPFMFLARGDVAMMARNEDLMSLLRSENYASFNKQTVAAYSKTNVAAARQDIAAARASKIEAMLGKQGIKFIDLSDGGGKKGPRWSAHEIANALARYDIALGMNSKIVQEALGKSAVVTQMAELSRRKNVTEIDMEIGKVKNNPKFSRGDQVAAAQSLARLTPALAKQSLELAKQDVALGKQDVALSKQNVALGKQNVQANRIGQMMARQNVAMKLATPAAAAFFARPNVSSELQRSANVVAGRFNVENRRQTVQMLERGGNVAMPDDGKKGGKKNK